MAIWAAIRHSRGLDKKCANPRCNKRIGLNRYYCFWCAIWVGQRKVKQ